MKKITKVLIIVTLCLGLIVGGGVGYFSVSGYKSDYKIFTDENNYTTVNSTVTLLDDKNIEFMPKEIKAGLIFYPGGSVEYTAYAPLLERLADNGILCVLVKMPLDLAVFNSSAADGIVQKYPDCKSWYIGGHSLGGAMAASYFDKNSDDFDGLILLAAYSTADISGYNKNVLSIYGSLDGVLNKERYEQYRSNLPEGFGEVIIDGGCHSYFGDYGNQKNDGTPTITREEQINKTVDCIVDMIDINN